uniref:Two component transcriptional regulator, LuxR family n=1 Tax=Leptospirillum ferrodiazotrophum TaxID=412449 RepID=C6I025_9BACT|nr:MAG: two component transcriptional regulator, LuxR family [Leptospirillum ferrodiazotrophum]
MTRVFLVEDHPLMRQGLVAALGQVPEIAILGEAESGEEALAALLPPEGETPPPAERTPDVVVMDIGLPGLSGIETTRRLKAARPDLRILMFTVHQLEGEIFGAFSSGADGYCLKDSELDSLILGIQAVALGSLYVDPRIAHLAIRRILSSPAPETETPLSARETEVLRLLAEGQSNRDIAVALGISVSTVKAHIQSILVKLSAATRADAAVKAFRKGWI